jgi:hypothetical protein
MADLYDLYLECRRRGLNVKGLSGWSSWQNGYWFRREGQWSGSGSKSNPPTFFIDHHTATAAYTPNVKNSSGQSKANIWLGLSRPGTSRYYSTGSGEAQAAFAVRWAANYGNGACIRKVYEDYVWRDRVVPGAARTWTSAGDNGYANKLGIGMEIVHLGDGSQLHPGVFELACQINAAAEDVFGWKKNQSRIIGHEDSTRRKVDPRFAQGAPYTMEAIRTRVAQIHGGTPPDEEAVTLLPFTTGMGIGDEANRLDDIEWLQRELNEHPATTPKLNTDGKYGAATEAAVVQVFPGTDGKRVGGKEWGLLEKANRGAAGTQGPKGDTGPAGPKGDDGESSAPEHTHVFTGTTEGAT